MKACRRVCSPWFSLLALWLIAAVVLVPGQTQAARALGPGSPDGFLGSARAAAPAAVALPAGFQDRVVLGGLTHPTNVQFASDGRVFVAEKSGLIKVFQSANDTQPPTLFGDLRTSVDDYWDRGLLGLALDPSFPAKPYVYAMYTYDAAIGGTAPRWNDACPTPPGPTTNGCVVSGRLVRLHASGNVATGGEQVLINDWCQQFPSHSVGSLAFGADGDLYVSAGDGASYGYADYGQTGNPCGDPPGAAGTNLTPPTAEGGALRSQSARRAAGEPVTLNGALLRVDPDTGQAMADNPFASSPEPNMRRIVAYGMRNPFRFTMRPGTSEAWIGDVGWGTWEEIDKVTNPRAVVGTNFGWPCYEGAGPQPGYQSANLNLCATLAAAAPPVYTYSHSNLIVANESCPTANGSAIAGLAFYDRAHEGGDYPVSYDGALFFADHSRNCIWVMRKGTNGEPNPNDIVTFAAGGGGPVDLKIGPGGDLFYAGYDDGAIHRISYFGSNTPPTARATATPTSGLTPLTVRFDGTGSSDPNATDILSYSWDLNGDGTFGDSTQAQPTYTYQEQGVYTARLRVTDNHGASDVARVLISAGNTPPEPNIISPSGSLHWTVGDTITFSGSATDAQDGPLPPSMLSWTLAIHHCTAAGCHSHDIQSWPAVASGALQAPDHEYPSYLELALTATDSGGLTSTWSVQLHPKTVDLTFASNPAGLRLTTGAESRTAPFVKTVIVGSGNSIGAPTPQMLNGATYVFSSWSDGGAQTHNITAPAAPTTYTATFSPRRILSMVAAVGLDGAGWVRREDATGWRSIGGRLLSPPAAVGFGGRFYYLGEGTDHNVWVRTDNSGWSAFGPVGTWCHEPAAAIQGTTLWVGCQGANKALWVSTATLGTTAPRVASWKSYGGYLLGGPGMAPVSNVMTFAVTGGDSRLWLRTPQLGWAPLQMTCAGRPALATLAPASWLACHGPGGALSYASAVSGGWGPVRSAGGSISGGPGLAVRSDGTASVFVELAADRSVARNLLSGGAAAGWLRLGGAVIGGVQAGEISTP